MMTRNKSWLTIGLVLVSLTLMTSVKTRLDTRRQLDVTDECLVFLIQSLVLRTTSSTCHTLWTATVQSLVQSRQSLVLIDRCGRCVMTFDTCFRCFCPQGNLASGWTFWWQHFSSPCYRHSTCHCWIYSRWITLSVGQSERLLNLQGSQLLSVHSELWWSRRWWRNVPTIGT